MSHGPAIEDDDAFLTELVEAMTDRPLNLNLEEDRKRYVPVYEAMPPEEDPIRLLHNRIKRSRRLSAAHLFSGYRGSGKSTELRRLERMLRDDGFDVFVLDMDGFLDPFTPVKIGDYLLDIAGAFDEVASAAGKAPSGPTLWDRMGDFFTSWRIDSAEIGAEVGLPAGVPLSAGVSLKVGLRENPVLRRRLGEHLESRLEVVVRDLHGYIKGRAQDLSSGVGVVLLVDSTEKLIDADLTGEQVKSSVRALFTQHAKRLELPGVQVVYSVPPDLAIREPEAIQTNFAGQFNRLTAVTVEERPESGERAVKRAGVEALHSVLTKRHADVERLLGSRDAFLPLILASGGHMRNLLYLVNGVISRTFDLPASDRAVDGAVRQLATDFRYLTEDELAWLAPIARTGAPHLATSDDRARFADFLDRQVVLPYRNGDEWFDVMPCIREMLLDNNSA